MKLKQWDTCQLCNESISEKDFDKHLLIRHFMTIYDALYKVSFPVKCNCGEPLEDVFKALDHVVDKHEILQNEYMAILRKREMGGETKIGIKKAIESWNFDKRFKKMSPVKVENKSTDTIKKETLTLDDVKTDEDDFKSNESFSDNDENPGFKETSKSWKIPGQIIKNKAKKNNADKRAGKIMFKNQVLKSETKNSVLKKPKHESTIQEKPCSENDGKRVLEKNNDKVNENIGKDSKKPKIDQKENDQKPNSDQQMQKMIEVLGNQDAKIVQLTGQNEALLLENSNLKSLNSEMNAIIETINNEMEERFNDLTNDLKEKTDENAKLANELKEVKEKLAILETAAEKVFGNLKM